VSARRRAGSKLTCRSGRRETSSPGPTHVSTRQRPPAGEEVALTGRVSPEQQCTEVTKHSPREPREGQKQKASKRKGRESWMAAVSPPHPSQPQVMVPRCPGPSTTSEAGTGHPGGPSCCSTRRLVSARRAPAQLSLQGCLVLRSFVGQRPEGSHPAPPFRAAHHGAMVTMIPASERAGVGPVLPAGAGSPRS